MLNAREVRIWCRDEDKEYDVTYLVNYKYDELLNRRVFESHRDAQFTLLVLDKYNKFSLEHGLTCPADFKNAIKKIESLEKY